MPGEKQRSQQRTAALFKKVIKRTLKVPEKLTVSEWAEKYRDLGETSSISGKWSNDFTPYLKEIMDAFSNPYIQEINFCKPTQVGGTEVMNNMIGYAVTQSPAPAMIIYPTDEIAKDVSKDRIQPSLMQTKEIKESYDPRRSNQKKLKFRGMTLYLTGAGNPTKLASKAIKYLFFDEIDKLDGASKKEASPYNLAKERTRTYPYSKKIYTCSTPTLKTNYVWKLHENAEVQKEFFMKCPHCGTFFNPDFHQIKFQKDEDMSMEERAKTAVYICKDCGCEISDREKIKAVRFGEWKVTKGEDNKHPRTISFRMNCLSSRFLTWEDIALEFLKTKDDPEQLQNFINSWLAEPWEDTKLKTSSELVLERQTELPELVVPKWAKLLTGGVDVQENCLYWTIRAWGNFMTSQNITHGQAFSFNDIEQIMNLEYKKEDGQAMVVNLCLIDSGYNADETYDFCARNTEWALPVKGSSNPMQTHYKFSTVNKTSSSAHGMNLVIVDGGKYKDMIAGRMRKENGNASWMVYKGCDEEYARQVTAEHKVSVKNGKTSKMQWVQKTSHADNHYLDCEVYAMAAADTMGVRMMHLQDEVAPVQQVKQEEYVPEESWIKKNEGNWI